MPSRWDFLNPHFRVLFGWETGWFIYTPVAIFFMAGMFFLKKYPFRKSVIIFCLLSIYIVISHHDWRYGATYSCRALSHMYPVFALPLGAFIERISTRRTKYLFLALGIYLVFVNLFQLRQYNQTILHFRDMNMKYYFSIYLNPHPSPLDMSLLDTNDRLRDERAYAKKVLFFADTLSKIVVPEKSEMVLFKSEPGKNVGKPADDDQWLKIEMSMKINNPEAWGGYINSELKTESTVKRNRIRMRNPIFKPGVLNDYAFFVKIPPYHHSCDFKLFVNSPGQLDADLSRISVQYFGK